VIDLDYKYARDLEYKNKSPVCILILHGLAGTPFEMKSLAERLSNEGYDVFVPIIPYHGKTIEHLLELQDPTEIYEWGKQLIHKKKQEYEKLIVIGFSLGAGITFVAETSSPTADAYIGISTGGMFSWMLKLFSFVYRFIKIKAIPFSISKSYNRNLVDKAYLDWKLKNMNKMPMNPLVHAVKQTRNLKKDVKKLVTPFLIINGTKDLATSKKVTSFMVQNASSKIKQGIIVKGGEHMLVNTSFFKRLLKEILEFINQIIENGDLEITKLITVTI
jgi:esterase/lipase